MKKLLICDDEPYILETIKFIAQKEGFEIFTAQNGQEAIDIVMSEKPDIIFLDYSMPVKNGFEVCESIRKNEGEQRAFIVMLTAQIFSEEEIRQKESLFDEYIVKPFSPEKIKKIVKKSCKRGRISTV